jgi:CheY-like chemotaxis protein
MRSTRECDVNPSIRPILLVEDNPMDLDLTLQALEGLEYMEKHRSPSDLQVPIVVLLDLRLPKVDGIEVLRQARRDPVWRQVPIVVMTTSRENRDVETAYELGVNSYIVKPVDFLTFTEVVKSIKVYWLLTNEPPFRDGSAR